MCKEFNYEDCYRLAIEERGRHQQNYNHWMNMYAIFNGALLIAFTADGVCDLFKLLISLLGIVTSTLWVCSVNGYYDWIISWIKIVSFYEAKLKIEDSNDKVYVYRLFAKTKNKFPFSTQKCTKAFTVSVLISWGILLIYEILKIFSNAKLNSKIKDIFILIKKFLNENLLYVVLTLVAFSVIILLIFSLSKKLREDLTKTHKNLSKSKTIQENILDSDLEIICEFDNKTK